MNFNFKGKKVFFFSCFNYDYLKEKKTQQDRDIGQSYKQNWIQSRKKNVTVPPLLHALFVLHGNKRRAQVILSDTQGQNVL